MATIIKTPAGTYKGVVRKRGWPLKSKTFRLKRDAIDWARRVEDEMVRSTFIDRGSSERISLSDARDRYLAEVSPTKKPSTTASDHVKARALKKYLGKYSLAALTPETISRFRDDRLHKGKSPSTVRLELALLSHLFTIAMREWRSGLVRNPVALVRKPAPTASRNRRLGPSEERRLLAACDAYSNPLLGWIVRLALHTGMRQGEILTLTRDQVDLSRRIDRLTETKSAVARPSQRTFLGYRIDGRGVLRISVPSRARLIGKLRQLLRRARASATCGGSGSRPSRLGNRRGTGVAPGGMPGRRT